MQVRYLVTTRADIFNTVSENCRIWTVDGTIPGTTPRTAWGDRVFDHHRPGGKAIQIDEMPLPLTASLIEETFFPVKEIIIATTQVDADACVAAAWVQLRPHEIDPNNLEKLRAIAYDCDHLAVPPELSHLADFAAQAVAALKSGSDTLVAELELPADRKVWSLDQKEFFNSHAFKIGTESIVDACRGIRAWPGENGEAAEYWQKVEHFTEQIIRENRVSLHGGCLLFDAKGFGGKYVDPRCWLKAAKQMGLNAEIPITLTQREVFVDNEYKGLSYTIGVVPLHPKVANLDLTRSTFHLLTKAEKEINPEADGWGGRATVGGSGWNTPSQLSATKVLEIVIAAYVDQ